MWSPLRAVQVLASVLVALAACHGNGDPAAVLFDAEAVQLFELTLPPATLQGLMAQPRQYHRGTLVWQGRRLEDVGVRLKGRTSFRPIEGKAAFKIKVDEFVPGQRLLGLRRLTFNNMVQDPSWARERLAYHLYREVGAPAPRCNSARLMVNGERWGVYANVETLDDEFVEDRFGKPIGNLYDTSNAKFFVDLDPKNLPLFERETQGQPADGGDLLPMLRAMTGPEATFLEDAAGVVDVGQFLLVAAVQAVLADWDGFFAATNNYEIYRDPDRGRFLVLPWGEDQTFGKRDQEVIGPDYAIDHARSQRPHSLFLDRCLRSRPCTARYLDAIERVMAAWDRLDLGGELAEIDRQLAPFGAEGRAAPAAGDRTKWLDQLRTFIAGRAAGVRAEVARLRAR